MSVSYQFRSKSIVSFYKRDSTKRAISAARQTSIDKFLKQKTYTGDVTNGSQKRLTRCLENLVQVAKPKQVIDINGKPLTFTLNFMTLTMYEFGRRIPGKEAHKTCLEPFLRWLRGKGMSAYVWKAELQSKRVDCHQLHYHLTTDAYVDAIELRDKWNQLQRDAGYLNYFHEKFGHWTPNSTDVHAVYKKKNVIGYLKKAIVRYSDKKRYNHFRSKTAFFSEMAKDVQNNESIGGKVWDASQNIKISFFEIGDLNDSRIKNGVACKELVKKEFERCIVYEVVSPNRSAHEYLPYLDRQFYFDHIEKMRTYQRIRPDISVFSTS